MRHLIFEPLATQLDEAEDRGDEEAVRDLYTRIIWPAESLLAARDCQGADWITKMGFNTIEAKRKYGNDWLTNDKL